MTDRDIIDEGHWAIVVIRIRVEVSQGYLRNQHSSSSIVSIGCFVTWGESSYFRTIKTSWNPKINLSSLGYFSIIAIGCFVEIAIAVSWGKFWFQDYDAWEDPIAGEVNLGRNIHMARVKTWSDEAKTTERADNCTWDKVNQT